MQELKKRFEYLFTSTRGLALVGIAAVSLVTAIWGTLSGPMVEWGVRDITVKLLGFDLVQAEREGHRRSHTSVHEAAACGEHE